MRLWARLSWFAAPATLAMACSTTSIYQTPNSVQYPLPPPPLAEKPLTGAAAFEQASEKRLEAQPDKPAVLWWTRYSQARAWESEDKGKACDLYRQSAAFDGFPLAGLARLRAMDACADAGRPGPAPEGPPRDELAAIADQPWLTEIALRAGLKQAEAAGDKVRLFVYSSELAKEERAPNEKTALLRRALKLARELGDQEGAAAARKRLEAFAPRFMAAPKASDMVAYAHDLRRAREFDAARAAYRRIVDGPFSDDQKFRALDGLRMTYKLERRLDEWAQHSRARAAFASSLFRKKGRAWLDRYYDAQVDLARVLWTQVSPQAASAALDELERAVGRRRPIDEALWVRARIEEEAGHPDRAVALLARAEAGPTRGGPALKSKIRWYRAWNMSKIGQLEAAADLLEELAPTETSPTNAARDRYWSAKWRAQIGKKDDAARRFEALIESDALGFYGLLAHRELGRKLPPLTNAASPPSPAPLSRIEDRVMFEWLSSCGEGEIARRLLDARLEPLRGGDDEAFRLRLRAYARAGAFGRVFELLSSAQPAFRDRLLTEEPSLLFPRPLPNVVGAAARASGVPAELLYAIMRQESSFDAHARSPADAFGLMQLIPSVAAHANARAKVDYKEHEDLYRPEINVPLGAAFLRELLDRWGGQLVLAAASYNASDRAISGWLKTRFRGDPISFVEEIPYDETRGYVKLVARNFVFYSRLTNAGRAMEFPAEVLAVDPARVGAASATGAGVGLGAGVGAGAGVGLGAGVGAGAGIEAK